MLQYQELEQFAHDYSRIRLENADRHRLLRLLPYTQPYHSEQMQQLAHIIGLRLVQWGRQLQGAATIDRVSATSAPGLGK